MKKIWNLGISGILIASTLFGITSSTALAETAPVGTQISTNDQPALRFSVISDIHVEAGNKESQSKIKQALNDLHTIAPDSQALVVNGDLGHGTPGDYITLKKMLKDAPLPPNVFYTIGNHEYYNALHDRNGNWSLSTFPNGETEKASQERFLNFVGRQRLYDDVWVSGYHFIMLGSEAYRQSDASLNEDAWLSDTQLTWLINKLKEQERKDKPIFVFLHQPLPFTVAGSSIPYNSRGVVQYEKLKEILAEHPQVIFFSGHTHWELSSANTLVKDKFTMVNTSSVYEPYDEADRPYDQKLRKSEGLAVNVYPNKVVIKGRDFTNQAWIPKAQFELKIEQQPTEQVQQVQQVEQMEPIQKNNRVTRFWIQWEKFVENPVSFLANSTQ
jgi:Icc protein